MKSKHFWIALFFTAAVSASPAMGALLLADVPNPTLTTLINMGSTPVQVGSLQFDNFGFVNVGATGVTAAEIEVVPVGNGASGIQFDSSWFAANGAYVDQVIAFDVQAIDPTQQIGQIDLFSNGTAPVPVSGTFTSNTLVGQLPGGSTAAPLISTYDEGVNLSGTGKPNVDFVTEALAPQPQLYITDTIFESSTAPGAESNGGVATESVVQNAFAAVPEPAPVGWICMPAAGILTGMNRRGVKRRRI